MRENAIASAVRLHSKVSFQQIDSELTEESDASHGEPSQGHIEQGL